MQLTHACCEFTNKIIERSLLIADSSILFLLLILTSTCTTVTVVDCLTSNISHDIVTRRYILVDLPSKISSTKWALCFDLKPILAAFQVEVVLRIATKCNNLIFRGECNQTDCAVWHFSIFVQVRFMTCLLQTLNVSLQRKLS